MTPREHMNAKIASASAAYDQVCIASSALSDNLSVELAAAKSVYEATCAAAYADYFDADRDDNANLRETLRALVVALDGFEPVHKLGRPYLVALEVLGLLSPKGCRVLL